MTRVLPHSIRVEPGRIGRDVILESDRPQLVWLSLVDPFRWLSRGNVHKGCSVPGRGLIEQPVNERHKTKVGGLTRT